MKKVIVINKITSTKDVSCCNVFKKVNWFKCLLSSKKLEEKILTDKFNAIAEQGFEFQDEKVLPHSLYVENEFKEKSFHGVYRFTPGKPGKYQVYFGPLIEVNPDKGCAMGCKGAGCKDLGCKDLGCKGMGCKSLGCRSKGGNTQYINFTDDSLNQTVVQKLNSHFGLRKLFNKNMNYIYKSYTFESINEIIKDRYDEIVAQYQQDVTEFYNQGLRYIRTIDTPSYEDIFTQAMLFGTYGADKVKIASPEAEEKHNIKLSRFDVWYFPQIKGILRILLELIPFISKKNPNILGTSIIEEQNIKIVETQYESDFNDQENQETELDNTLKAAIVGKIPVTIAVKKRLGFWSKIFSPIKYDFHTYIVSAVKE